MAEREQKITDEGGLHAFRTEIPNTVVRGLKSRGLSVHAKWLYVYFKSVCGDGTECYRTTTTISLESGLSRAMVSTAKRELAAKGLILIKKSKNPNRQADHIRIKNIWIENFQEFSVLLANAGKDEIEQENSYESGVSVPLANAKEGQRSISERSVLLANSSVLLANQRRSQEEDPSEEVNPSPLPPAGEKQKGIDTEAITTFEDGYRQPPTLKDDGETVLAHLNTVTGRHYDEPRYILARLRAGATVGQCLLVIDWLHVVRRVEKPQWVEECLDNDTPFRDKVNFGKYLARAQPWDNQGRPEPGSEERQVPVGERRSVENAIELIQEISGGGETESLHRPGRHRPLLQGPQ